MPAPLFVDVGANLGWMAALAAHWGCRVIAFEPQVHDPFTFQRDSTHIAQLHLRLFWRATSALNRWSKRVVWVPAAVGDVTGAVFRLQRPVSDWGQVHAGTADFNAAEAASHDNFLPGESSADDVAVIRVTDVVQSAAALKIDVEGSEAAAMRSCDSLLRDPALQLATIEFQGSSEVEYSEEVFARLQQQGMSAYIFQEEYFRSHCSPVYLLKFVLLQSQLSAQFLALSLHLLAPPLTPHRRSIRSRSPRMQGFPIMPVNQFQGLSKSKPFDDLFFTRDALPSSWLWDMQLTDAAHRDALQQLQNASPHEQSLAAMFLSRWSRNVGDMDYFAHMGDIVCRLHLNMGQLLRASNDCYILWSVSRDVQHALMAISAQRASGRWEQAETTLAQLGVVLRSSLSVPAAIPLQLLAQAGVPGSILNILPLQSSAPSAPSSAPTAQVGARGIALALVHCNNPAVASVAFALAQKSAMLVCIGNRDVCPSWCAQSFHGRFDGQCSCETSLQAVSEELGGGIGVLLDACREDDGGCAFEPVAPVHAAAAAMRLPVIVYSDSYHGQHTLLSRAFVVAHAPLHAPDTPMAFDRSLRVSSLDIIRFPRAAAQVHDIAGWGASAPAHSTSLEQLRLMIAHARAQHRAAASSSPIVFVLHAAAATPSIAADIAAASAQGAHIVLGTLLPDAARLWVEALLKLGAHSARLFWCELSVHGPEDALPYREPRPDAGCTMRLQAAAVAADVVFDARPAGGSVVEVLQHCIWGALPAIAPVQSPLHPHRFERAMQLASFIVGLVAPVRLSGAHMYFLS